MRAVLEWLKPAAAIAALVGGILWVGIQSGRPTTEAELDALAARTQLPAPGRVYSRARFKGSRRGVTLDPPVEWSFGDMKRAWRAGTWRLDPDMRRKFLVTTGGIALVAGMFLLFAALFEPPSVRLLLVGAVIYVAVRLAITVRRAPS